MLMTMDGVVRHRLLINYAADPDVVAPLLPAPFRPHVVGGRALVGICALRLAELRPAGLPAALGRTTDNAAHRIAVEWDGADGGRQVGVFVLRRDTAQRLPALAGGRLFPGVHGRAPFQVEQEPDRLRIAFTTADGLELDAVAGPAGAWSSEVFPDLAAASSFFEAGECGWSPARGGGLEGVALSTAAWAVEPVSIDVRASFYDDPARFPPGSIRLDAALLMRDVPVTWTRLSPARMVA